MFHRIRVIRAYLDVCKYQHSLHVNAKHKIFKVSTSSVRLFSTKRVYLKNFYEALGVSKDASQMEIKTAYYKLSKIHHPDKNHGCPSSAQNFKCITEAYETLTNEKLRNLYDKNLLHHNKSQRNKHMNSRNINYSNTSARSPYETKSTYGFDIWFANHYGQSVESRYATKLNYKRNMSNKNEDQNEKEKNLVVFCILLLSVCAYAYNIQCMFYNGSKATIPNNNQKPDKQN